MPKKQHCPGSGQTVLGTGRCRACPKCWTNAIMNGDGFLVPDHERIIHLSPRPKPRRRTRKRSTRRNLSKR
jgi:hypothetical protein